MNGFRYHLIVMDINMPVMDGTEATCRLMQLFNNNIMAKAPIVAVTAANMQTREDVQNLLSVGFSDICILFRIIFANSTEAGLEDEFSR